MTALPITALSLDLDCAARRLEGALGRGPYSHGVRAAAREVRRVAARLAAAEIAEAAAALRPGDDPVELVRLVAQAALDAGAAWPDVVAAVNQVRERRAG